MIQVTEYWEKVVDDPSCKPFGRRVLKGEYVVKSRRMVNNTLADLKERWKGNPRMTFEADKITEDNGAAWGIHSYTEITPA